MSASPGLIQAALSRPGFVQVRGGRLYYGGDQGWDRGRGLRGRYLSKTGCGPVALANLSFYFAGVEQVSMEEYRDRLRQILRLAPPPIATVGAFVRAAGKLFPGQPVRVLCSRRTGLEEALRAVAPSLAENRPVAMQIMGNTHGRDNGEERAVPWHWTVLTELEYPASDPEKAVYTHSTWGEKRRGLFSNAWEGGRGPFGYTNLVLFT